MQMAGLLGCLAHRYPGGGVKPREDGGGLEVDKVLACGRKVVSYGLEASRTGFDVDG